MVNQTPPYPGLKVEGGVPGSSAGQPPMSQMTAVQSMAASVNSSGQHAMVQSQGKVSLVFLTNHQKYKLDKGFFVDLWCYL